MIATKFIQGLLQPQNMHFVLLAVSSLVAKRLQGRWDAHSTFQKALLGTLMPTPAMPQRKISWHQTPEISPWSFSIRLWCLPSTAWTQRTAHCQTSWRVWVPLLEKSYCPLDTFDKSFQLSRVSSTRRLFMNASKSLLFTGQFWTLQLSKNMPLTALRNEAIADAVPLSFPNFLFCSWWETQFKRWRGLGLTSSFNCN